jgi:ubiquinone/menaquinone biosynthesis C-methylase UbiE
MEGLEYHDSKLKNFYLKMINSVLADNVTVLDVGCGTGLISNLFARKYPTAHFTSIDFADSVDYARAFATAHKIQNVKYIKQDFLEQDFSSTFDIVICQGVLHHIPNGKQALTKLKSLVAPGGKLVLGLYHPWGKIVKRFLNIDYNHDILYMDQEKNPFETTYNFSQVMQLCNEFDFVRAGPSILNKFLSVSALINYRNGGLITYILEKKYEIY